MYCRAKETARDREAKGIDSEAREMRYMGGVLTFLLRGLYWAGILRDWMGVIGILEASEGIEPSYRPLLACC
jgi:hypothetical protein